MSISTIDDEGAGTPFDAVRSRAANLCRFLTEFARMRHKPILDCGRYEAVLWVHELPDSPLCRSAVDTDLETGSRSEDAWLVLGRMRRPSCPSPPRECYPWLESTYPFSANPDQEPTIASTIRVVEASGDEGEDESPNEVVLSLEDHPLIRDSFESYLIEEWLPWTDRHAEWEKYNSLYSRVYTMYQDSERLGEQYELIAAWGLLSWNTDTDRNIRRHLLTARSHIEFEARSGELRILPSPTGNDVLLEDEIVPPEVRSRIDGSRFRADAKPTLDEDPWERAHVDPVLTAFAQSLHPEAEYSAALRPEVPRSSVPRVDLAPAFILRKRDSRSLINALGMIIGQLEDGGDVPDNLRLILSSGGDAGTEPVLDDTPAAPGEILFPLPWNDEQRKIVEKIEVRDAVLVQGPPGTGKSHTIANLLSHFLAQGRRVLVTAQTSRALAVLREKVPVDLQPLCISYLGNDRTSIRELNENVQQIQSVLDSWNTSTAAREIAGTRQRLDYSARRRAELERERYEARLLEAHPLVGLAPRFHGSPAHVARQTREEQPLYGWYSEQVDAGKQPPIDGEGLGTLLRAVEEFDEDARLALALPRPSASELLSADDLAKLSSDEALARGERDAAGVSIPGSLLDAAPQDVLMALGEALDDLEHAIESASRPREPWTERAVADVLEGAQATWTAHLEALKKSLAELEDAIPKVGATSVTFPEQLVLETVLADAEDLKKYFARGGRDGAMGMFSAEYRRLRHVLEVCRMDGRKIAKVDLSRLVRWLKVEVVLAGLDRTWLSLSGNSTIGDGSLRRAAYIDRRVSLERILAAGVACELVRSLLQTAQVRLESRLGVPQDRQELRLMVRREIAARSLVRIEETIEEQRVRLAKCETEGRTHPVVQELERALVQRNIDAYRARLNRLAELGERAARQRRVDEMLESLRQDAPILWNLVQDPAQRVLMLDRAPEFEKAWEWAAARTALDEVQARRSIERIDEAIRDVDEEKRELVGQLCRLTAWDAFRERLTGEKEKHLRAWEQAVRRLGKGTGKHASRHRENARMHLGELRDAVPVWIMPLYQVFETVTPKAGAFDVVIVDEASQCGLDALALLYLGKKIVVVGDDEQISPDAVGINQDDLWGALRRLLPDFEMQSVFAPDASLFDVGRTWFSRGEIQLREHFRCMPEIIEFCNQLSYRGKPLVPLRQFQVDRLPPVQAVYIRDGHRRGGQSNTENVPEAEALVEKVVECIRDQRYEGKSMGVISLLGKRQAQLISEMLLREIGPERMEERRLVCGDSYSFQGDERDVMFLSMVGSKTHAERGPTSSPAQTRRNTQQRYNVAVSRARDQLWLFHSLHVDELGNAEDLRRRLLQYCLQPTTMIDAAEGLDDRELRLRALRADRTQDRAPRPFRSWFEVDVYLDIRERGFRARPAYQFAGYEIDIMVEGAKGRLAVECDGDDFHGQEAYQQDFARQWQLERAGLRFWRVRASAYYMDRVAALQALWEQLHVGGIEPVNHRFDSVEVAEELLAATDAAQIGAAAGQEPTTAQEVTPSPPQRGAASDLPLAIRREETSDPEEVVESLRLEAPLRLADYVPWRGSRLEDPKSAKLGTVIANLVEIVQAEGPMLTHVAYRRYAAAAGLTRVGSRLRERFDRALRDTLRSRDLAILDEDRPGLGPLVAPNGSHEIVPRSLGDRKLDEVPDREISVLVRALIAKLEEKDPETLARHVVTCYGLRRLRASTRVRLEGIVVGVLRGGG